MGCGLIFLFKQKTAYEVRISDWSSDVCSSDLREPGLHQLRRGLVGVGTGGHRTSPVGGCHRHDDRAPPNVTWYGTARAKNFPEAVLRRDIKISDRKSVVSGKSVSVRVDIGGLCIIRKTNYYEIKV